MLFIRGNTLVIITSKLLKGKILCMVNNILRGKYSGGKYDHNDTCGSYVNYIRVTLRKQKRGEIHEESF